VIRQGDWKLLYNMQAPHQLFNLKEDPEELRDVWQAEREVASQLEKELRKVCDPEAVNALAHEWEARQLAEIDDILSDPNGASRVEWQRRAGG